jgi:hypothetical protein
MVYWKLAVFLLKLLLSWEWLHFEIKCYVILSYCNRKSKWSDWLFTRFY